MWRFQAFGKTHLLIMFAASATGLDKHEALGPFYILFTKGTTLTMLDRKVVCCSVDKLEGGKHF